VTLTHTMVVTTVVDEHQVHAAHGVVGSNVPVR
jgi:hypothetical protein